MLAAALASLPPGLSSTPREEGQRRRPWQQGRGRLAVAAAQAAGGAPHPRIPAPQDTATRGPGSTKSAAKTSSSRPGLQHTLRRSFTIGGVGLHTGEYAYVRVAPAFAGEGRYFVRVPTGTISPEWEADRPAPRRLDDMGAVAHPPPSDSLGAQLFFDFIESEGRGGFVGTFTDYMQQRTVELPDALSLAEPEAEQVSEEEPWTGQLGEARLPAEVCNLQHGQSRCTVLALDGTAVWGTEHLLAALECCGVDNARIEVEGGKELPVIDGSALGWASEIGRAGMQLAHGAPGGEPSAHPRTTSPQQVLTVQEGESFISFYPGPTVRVTVGVDGSAEAPVIGQQWFTWSPEDPMHEHFNAALAPARTWFTSAAEVNALREEGLLQGGADYVSIIGDGDDWLDPQMVRFPADEAARHAMVDLLGDLALLARPGGRGVPAGHIVAYQPTHALQAAFLKQLQRAIDSSPA